MWTWGGADRRSRLAIVKECKKTCTVSGVPSNPGAPKKNGLFLGAMTFWDSNDLAICYFTSETYRQSWSHQTSVDPGDSTTTTPPIPSWVLLHELFHKDTIGSRVKGWRETLDSIPISILPFNFTLWNTLHVIKPNGKTSVETSHLWVRKNAYLLVLSGFIQNLGCGRFSEMEW